MLFKDQMHRVFELKDSPKRIISLVPSQTELLCDLGLEDLLVGITKFCVHPTNIKTTKTIVGGTKQIKLDKIKALQPDIILCNKEENTKEIVEACEKICSVHVSDIASIEDCLEMIEHYGELFNKKEEAQELQRAINDALNNFNAFISKQPVVKVAYCIWKDPWMVAGNDTFIDFLLTTNKFENAFSSKNRYPEITIQELGSRTIDIVLLSSEPFPFKEKHIEALKEALNNETKIILVDGEMFSWYGSRLLKAFDYFKELRNSL